MHKAVIIYQNSKILELEVFLIPIKTLFWVEYTKILRKLVNKINNSNNKNKPNDDDALEEISPDVLTAALKLDTSGGEGYIDKIPIEIQGIDEFK